MLPTWGFYWRLSVCLSVCLSVYPHDISKIAAAKITKHNVEMVNHESWKLVYVGVKRHKRQCQCRFLYSCECWLFLIITHAGIAAGVSTAFSRICLFVRAWRPVCPLSRKVGPTLQVIKGVIVNACLPASRPFRPGDANASDSRSAHSKPCDERGDRQLPRGEPMGRRLLAFWSTPAHGKCAWTFI